MTSRAEALAPEDQSDSCEQAKGDSAGWTNPAVVEGILDEVGNSGQNRDDHDSVEPQLPNLALELFSRFFIRGSQGKRGRRNRYWSFTSRRQGGGKRRYARWSNFPIRVGGGARRFKIETQSLLHAVQTSRESCYLRAQGAKFVLQIGHTFKLSHSGAGQNRFLRHDAPM